MKTLILFAAAAALASPALAQDMNGNTSTSQSDVDAAAAAADAAYGYQPDHPAMSGTPQPGSKIIYRQAPPPSVAYPAPAALDHYPVCKPGQFDNCRQRGG